MARESSSSKILRIRFHPTPPTIIQTDVFSFTGSHYTTLTETPVKNTSRDCHILTEEIAKLRRLLKKSREGNSMMLRVQTVREFNFLLPPKIVSVVINDLAGKTSRLLTKLVPRVEPPR